MLLVADRTLCNAAAAVSLLHTAAPFVPSVCPTACKPCHACFALSPTTSFAPHVCPGPNTHHKSPVQTQSHHPPVHLKWPQEVGCLLECWAHSVDLVDQVLNAQDVLAAQGLRGSSSRGHTQGQGVGESK
jgi:hypothetical protein